MVERRILLERIAPLVC
ncbi:unnamed protein product, partial [Allacma fusca]